MEPQVIYSAPRQEEHPLLIEIKATADAMEIDVRSPIELEIAQDFIKQLKDLDKRVHEYWDSDINKAHELHKSLTSKRKVMLDSIEGAKREIDGKVSNYLLAERRRVEAEEEKARIAAREKEERERQKMFAEAEKAKAAGREEKAEALTQKAENHYVAPAPVSFAPKIKGLSERTTWDVVILDKKLMPLDFLVPDEQLLKKSQAAHRGQLKVPGVRFIERIIPITR